MPDAHRSEIEKLEALYAEHPEGRVFTHLAEAYRKAGQLDRAREVLDEGIARHPNYSSAHVVMGRVLVDQDSPEEARTEFRRVLELDAHNMVALRALGDLARNSGRTEEALDYYTRLLDVEPTDQDVRDVMAELRGEHPAGSAEAPAGQPAAGPGGVAAAPDAREEPPSPHGDPVGGLAVGEEGEPSAGEPGVTTETIAQVYARQGLYDRAADVYRQLLRNHPDNHAFRTRLDEMEELAARAEEGPVDESPLEAVSLDDASLDAASLDEESLDEVSGDLDVAYGAEEASAGEVEPLPGLDDEPGAGEIVELETQAGWEEEPATAPEDETLAGFESAEVDLDAEDVAPLAGLETDEKDPETGLATDGDFALGGGTPDTGEEPEPSDVMEPAEGDVVPGLDLGPTEAEPEPPDTEPAEAAWTAAEPPEAGQTESAGSDEPWLSASVSGSDQEAATADAPDGLEAHEPAAEPEPGGEAVPSANEPDTEDASVWTGVDEGGVAEETPYAWAEPDEKEADGSPPVADYLRGLLDWSGSPGAGPSEQSGEPVEASEPGEASEDGEVGGATDAGSAGSAAEPADREDDDDLDTFRSWLESLKQ